MCCNFKLRWLHEFMEPIKHVFTTGHQEKIIREDCTDDGILYNTKATVLFVDNSIHCCSPLEVVCTQVVLCAIR